jgi:hypothetical protein
MLQGLGKARSAKGDPARAAGPGENDGAGAPAQVAALTGPGEVNGTSLVGEPGSPGGSGPAGEGGSRQGGGPGRGDGPGPRAVCGAPAALARPPVPPPRRRGPPGPWSCPRTSISRHTTRCGPSC